MHNDITNREICQGKILKDTTNAGRVRPWAEQKAAAEQLADVYEFFDHARAERIRDCATWLKFRRVEGGLKLALADFCRVRLCPVCQWRRSLKIYGQMSKIFGALDLEQYAVITLNLTVQNCVPENIGRELDRVLDGFKRLMQYKDVEKIVCGYYRAVEITVNCNTESAWYGTLHPHIHSLLIVKRSYFNSRDYIKAARWCELWKTAARVDYDPNIMVGRLRIRKGQTITDALREVCKYTVKSSDILCSDGVDRDGIPDAARLAANLDTALTKRRFFGLGGVLKDIHKRLNLADMDADGDLIHAEDAAAGMDDETKNEIYYIWRAGVYVTWDGEA